MRADVRLMSRRRLLLPDALLPDALLPGMLVLVLVPGVLVPGMLAPGVPLGSRPEMRVLAASLKLIMLSLFHDDRLSMEPCV